MARRKKENPMEDFDMDILLPSQQLRNKISVKLKCKTETQKELIDSIRAKEITVCAGLKVLMVIDFYFIGNW